MKLGERPLPLRGEVNFVEAQLHAEDALSSLSLFEQAVYLGALGL